MDLLNVPYTKYVNDVLQKILDMQTKNILNHWTENLFVLANV